MESHMVAIITLTVDNSPACLGSEMIAEREKIIGMVCMPPMGIDDEIGALDALPASCWHFGEHFMVDAYRGSRAKLLDSELVQKKGAMLILFSKHQPYAKQSEPCSFGRKLY